MAGHKLSALGTCKRGGPSLHRRGVPIGSFEEMPQLTYYDSYEIKLGTVASASTGEGIIDDEVQHVPISNSPATYPACPASPGSPRSVLSIFNKDKLTRQCDDGPAAPSLLCSFGSFSFDDDGDIAVENEDKKDTNANTSAADFFPGLGCLASSPTNRIRSILRSGIYSPCSRSTGTQSRTTGGKGGHVRFSDNLVTEKSIPSIDEGYKSTQYYSQRDVDIFREKAKEEEQTGVLDSMLDVLPLTCVSFSDSLSYYSGAIQEVPLMSVFNLDEDSDAMQ